MDVFTSTQDNWTLNVIKIFELSPKRSDIRRKLRVGLLLLYIQHLPLEVFDAEPGVDQEPGGGLIPHLVCESIRVSISMFFHDLRAFVCRHFIECDNS